MINGEGGERNVYNMRFCGDTGFCSKSEQWVVKENRMIESTLEKEIHFHRTALVTQNVRPHPALVWIRCSTARDWVPAPLSFILADCRDVCQRIQPARRAAEADKLPQCELHDCMLHPDPRPYQ